MYRFALTSAFALLVPSLLAAQATRTVTGRLLPGDVRTPFAGAAVRVIGSDAFVCADGDGRFSIDAPTGEIALRITPVGFPAMDVTVTDGGNTVELPTPDHVVVLDAVEVIGYSSRSAATSANAVGRLTSRDVDRVPASTLEAALQGKVAGAAIESNSGAPGGGFRFGLRGVRTIFGNSDPVFVLDGVVISNASIDPGMGALKRTTGHDEDPTNRLADLNPADIESIEVFRGASAAASYGPRAGNGVVVITTKRGARPPPPEDPAVLMCFRG